ncbi:DUF4240 domain-containing protein [Aestuariibius sp. 2305UL40-4]|uniref:DUF4240 domain-containing protein n=1 Tax=Aestuariibius violaceus TaxID=3234132 RepID=UPI00345F0E86
MYDEIPLSETEVFRPRYDSLSKDLDRLMEHVSNLYHDDRLFNEFSKANAAGERAAIEIEDAYFARGLYAQIESQYTYTFEIAFGPPHQGMLDALERLIAAGQGQRAIRIWRNYLALQKSPFWSRIDERKRGFKMSPYWAASEKLQRNSHENLIRDIPRYKSGLLAMMDTARDIFLRAGATEAQLARLAADREEVEAEERRRPTGKPDPRKMDTDIFWEVIGTQGDGSPAEQIDAITDRLAMFKATPIKAFDTLLRELDAQAYRSDIWALASLPQDGCSDDAFEGFRCWLILQGREVFETTLADPDSFDTSLFTGEASACNTLRDAPPLAYEMRTGKALKRKKLPPLRLQGPEIEEEHFATALPRVAAALNT